MTNRSIPFSPQLYARTGGVLYLITIVLGIFNELLVKGRIVVSGDARTTAANLKSMETLWRLGIASRMVMVICAVVLSLVLYELLKPVNVHLALLATFFGLIATVLDAAYSLQLNQALFPLGDAGYLKAFTPEHLNAMASLSLKAHEIGYGKALLLFGPFFLLAGHLIFRSTYFPKAIGVLYQIAGVAYMANGFVLILAPSFGGQTFKIVALPIFIGEASFCLWLLVKGVNLERWNTQVELHNA